MRARWVHRSVRPRAWELTERGGSIDDLHTTAATMVAAACRACPTAAEALALPFPLVLASLISGPLESKPSACLLARSLGQGTLSLCSSFCLVLGGLKKTDM